MISPKNLDYSKYIGWGWKEPNSHIYLEHISEYFEGLKFIHVIRHGLDMAYSKNQQQLFNWGHFLGVDIPSIADLLPKAALEYWIVANKRAIAIGELLGTNKFLLLNFDKLCSSPRTEVIKITNFLQLDIKELDETRLYSFLKTPASTGRYKENDLSIFTREDIENVRQLGFEIEI